MRSTGTLATALAAALLATALPLTAGGAAFAADGDPTRYEAEDATIPVGSNATVGSESGASGEQYIELSRETGEQLNSIVVFEDAVVVPEPGIYQIDIGYKTVSGDYKKQWLKVIEPLDSYVVENKNLKDADVLFEMQGEFQSSGWGPKSFLLDLPEAGTFDFMIQGDWGFQDIDYIDVHPAPVTVDPTISVGSYRFYRSNPADLVLAYEPNYNEFVELQADGVAIDPSLYTADTEARRITISQEFFLTTAEETGTITVMFDGGTSPSFTYEVFGSAPVRSLLEAEDASILGTSKIHTEGDTTYVAIEGDGGVQWDIEVPEAGRYLLNIRYRATSGDKVENVVVRNDAGTLTYGTGFPITPFEISDENSRDGWEIVRQRVTLQTGFNSLSIEKDWGWTDIDYVQIGSDPDVPLPHHEAAQISPTRDVYHRNDPRDLSVHLDLNGNTLTGVTRADGTPVEFDVVEFNTSDLNSGYKADKRDVVLPDSAVGMLPLGQNLLTFAFDDGTTLTYTVEVREFVERGELQIVSFDVNHGNSTLFRLPNGKNLLVDSGKPEEARDTVLPYLATHGVVLDYYLVTHFHDDHTGMAEEIIAENGLAGMSKNEGIALATKGKDERFAKLRTLQYLDNTALLPGDQLDEIWDLGGLDVKILNSRFDEEGNQVADLDENNISIAAMIQYEGFKYLHQTDIYAKTNDVLLERFGDDPDYWDVDYLQGNHHFHGSVSPTFLRLTNPDLVFVPVSGAVWARGAYTTLYRDFVEKYLRANGGDLIDTVLSPASGSLVLDINGKDDWRYATYKNIAASDETAPVIVGAEDVEIDRGATFDPRAGVLAMDNVDLDVTVGLRVAGSVDTASARTYTLNYVVADAAGNERSLDRRVTVRAQQDDDATDTPTHEETDDPALDASDEDEQPQAAVPGDRLPDTGSQVATPLLVAGLLVLIGAATLLTIRRRRGLA